MKRKTTKSTKKPRWTMEVFNSFAEADEADRKYWRAKTPLERMQALEKIRGMAWGYDPDAKSRPKFQRVVEIVELRRS
jgi:hypothetical protein